MSASLNWSAASWKPETEAANLLIKINKMDTNVQNTYSNAFYDSLWILIEISLMLVPTDDDSTLFPLKAWHQTGNEPLSKPVIIPYSGVSMCHNTQMGEPSKCSHISWDLPAIFHNIWSARSYFNNK